MAWIESHQEVGRHPKTKKLARLLGVSLPAAVGHLHYLWWWALDFAPSGTLEKFDEYDIADAVHWDGEPEKLVDALTDVGYLDRDGNGVLRIHDWGEYAGKLLEKRAKDRARKRAAAEAAGVPQDFHRNESGENEDGAGVSDFSRVTVPNQPTNQPIPTVPNLTDSNQPQESGTGKPAPGLPPCPFSEILQLYNTTCVSFPRIRSIEGTRKKAVAARWRVTQKIDTFRELFEKAEASDFLKGVNDRNWSADFDWLMTAANMAKVLEGKYQNGGRKQEQAGGALGALRRLYDQEEGETA